VTKVIAIDGPAAAGKGTLARSVARHYGFAYLDTGLLYRALGARVLEAGGDPGDPGAAMAAVRAFDIRTDLDRSDLRSDQTASAASKVAALTPVREALLGLQRAFALAPPSGAGGVVLDGRDIGTVVCPDADVKLFITATLPVRAERRVRELRQRGLKAIHSQVLEDMETRDARDRQRAIAPLEPAADAFVIDTSALDPEAVFRAAISIVDAVTTGQDRNQMSASRPGEIADGNSQ
jgi:cytidylate kinase